MLATFGDPVERHFATRIAASFPSYARMWTEYIGNDGHSNLLPMPGGTEEAIQSRAEQWPRIYTIFESLALCWDIEDELAQVEDAAAFKPYAHNLNLWMAFYSHLGRIHDMIKVIVETSKVGKPELVHPFNQFWKERHILLHGPKVPLKWIDNVIARPQFGDGPKSWSDKKQWTDLRGKDFEFLGASVASALRELERRLERCISELRKVLPQVFDWKPVVWPERDMAAAPPTSLPSLTADLSGDACKGWPCQPSGTQNS
jgi:hypothetical protein